MPWNHRVVKRVHRREGEPHYTEFSIHEAFYTEDQAPNGRPSSITVKPLEVSAESVEELREVLGQMLKALDKEVVDFDDVWTQAPGYGWGLISSQDW